MELHNQPLHGTRGGRAPVRGAVGVTREIMCKTDWLDQVDHDGLTDALGELMSAVSEDTHCAGWLVGTQYIVPALCQRVLKINRAQPWGFGELGPGMAAVMQTIADKLGHWANLDEQGKGYVPFDPFPTPQEYLVDLDVWQRKQKRDPNQTSELTS